ncbi:MAG: hypothetical protein HDT36_04380 [Clostridiales bacterium]|nr:hypothetical protein [Clostridiales bacterium]
MNFQWLFDRPIAHRGLHNAEIPENSIPAYENAIAHNYNIEIDVHLTKDGHLVIFHDNTLKRVCGVDKAIKDCTLAELKTYRLLGTEYTIPTFDEFLKVIDGKVGILCEIKGINPFDNSIVKATLERLKTYNGRIAIQSFNYGAVKYARKHSSLPTGELFTWCSPDGKKPRWWVTSMMGKMWLAKLCKPQFLAYDVRACAPELSENKWLLKGGKKLPVLMWTVVDSKCVEVARKYANNIIFEYMDVDYVEECVGTFRPLK